MIIRCVIVDDEQPARDELRYLLSECADFEIVGEAESAGKAIELINKVVPDLVFLDIQMPGRNGFAVIGELQQMQPLPLFVFATAYDSYAVQAFEESAADYIMKPISAERLKRTIDRVRQLLAQKRSGAETIEDTLQRLLLKIESPRGAVRISVEKGGRIQLLSPESIVYCSYEGGTIRVYTGNDHYTLHGIATMDKLEEHLAGGSFFRTHRSVLVNLDMIREFSPWFNGKYNLIMKDTAGTELTVSRSRVKDFKRRLGI